MTTTDDEITYLRNRVEYLQQALDAVRHGDVDAMVGPVADPDTEQASGDQQVYSLVSADRPYRVLVEVMGQGAATTTAGGVILFANQQLASMLGVEREALIGRDLASYVSSTGAELDRLLAVECEVTQRAELMFLDATDPAAEVPALVAATALDLEGERLRCLIVTDLTLQKQTEQRQAEEAALEDQREERRRVAREVNDSIVQGLVAAEMALDLDNVHDAREAVARTSAQARSWIGQLVEGDSLQPGMAVRATPPEPVRSSRR